MHGDDRPSVEVVMVGHLYRDRRFGHFRYQRVLAAGRFGTWLPGVGGGAAGGYGEEVVCEPLGVGRLQRGGGDAQAGRAAVAVALTGADGPAPFGKGLHGGCFLLDRDPYAEPGLAVRGDAAFGERGDEGSATFGVAALGAAEQPA